MPEYRIHPGIGIARLGNSPGEFCIAPENPATLPVDCDAQGNALLTPDGKSERLVEKFKDSQGRIKRQAARFQVYVHDEQSPKGRPLKLGDPVEGGGNSGTLVDIQWRVYIANKKSVWFRFQQLQGEHGYDATHPRRNAGITDENARQQLIIDPGPRTINLRDRRSAKFNRDGGGVYAATFPPPLNPNSIDSLGEILSDDAGRLLVLGGFGNSGSCQTGFGQPRIDEYANNHGWFDDTSDGPVMARLVMFSEEVQRLRFVDVEGPAWVLTGYPIYAPQILDMVTLDDLMQDLAIREFAWRTDLFGDPSQGFKSGLVDPANAPALAHWKAGNRQWNPEFKPWFYRDVWPILFRPDEFTYLSNILLQSNFPHSQSKRGTFDVDRLSSPPMVSEHRLAARELEVLARNVSGDIFLESLEPFIEAYSTQWEHELAALAMGGETEAAEEDPKSRSVVKPPALAASAEKGRNAFLDELRTSLKQAAARFVKDAAPGKLAVSLSEYLEKWVQTARADSAEFQAASRTFSEALETGLAAARENLVNSLSAKVKKRETEDEQALRARIEQLTDHLLFDRVRAYLKRLVREFVSGKLLREAQSKARGDSVKDPYRDVRQYLYRLLRQPGEENQFQVSGKPNTRVNNLPLMPLLSGDNPLSNIAPSKFFRLTDYQLYLLRQWADGKFYNEEMEGWSKPDPYNPYANWGDGSGRDLDRSVLMRGLGGAFCPGAEVCWIIRNPAIYREPYRLKADPDFYAFRQTAASANAASKDTTVPEDAYISYSGDDLSQDNNFAKGLQPGDLTKYSALPWQADYNECTTQTINVTYAEWNKFDASGEKDKLQKQEEKNWEAIWWPAHRPLQVYEMTGLINGAPNYQFLDWSRGIPQTNAGDLKMVTAWSELGFVVLNPYMSPADARSPSNEGNAKYISVEQKSRTS